MHSIHFHADAKLVSYIERKMDRLSRKFDRIESVDVMLKLQDTGGKVHEKITEIRLQVPGGWLLDKKTGRSFETAVTASLDTLKRQLVRHKEKIADHRREA